MNIDALVADIVTLAPHANRQFMALGRSFRELKKIDKHRFQSAVKLSGLRRRAHYFVKLADALDGLDVPDDRLRQVGWVKLAAIAPKITKANALDLIEAAEKHSATNVRRLVREGDPLEGYRTLNLFLSAHDYELLRSVVIRHGATAHGRSLVGQEDALMRALAKLNKIESAS